MSREEKVKRFRLLHRAPHTFVIPNAWTIGTAKRLESLGFEAIATTSAGIALDLGLRDGEVGRRHSLDIASSIARAVDVPVSADLENCFSDEPVGCADTIREAIALGLAGGSIEDSTGIPEQPIYPLEYAVNRVRSAAEAAHNEGQDFVLTARAENFLHGRPDLDDTIARLNAYADAGADVLFAPGLPDLASVRAVQAAVNRPINVLLMPTAPFSLTDLVGAGVGRVSLGSLLARTAELSVIETATKYLRKSPFIR